MSSLRNSVKLSKCTEVLIKNSLLYVVCTCVIEETETLPPKIVVEVVAVEAKHGKLIMKRQPAFTFIPVIVQNFLYIYVYIFFPPDQRHVTVCLLPVVN